ncbi:PAS domain-containing sensor histidine kinase (plasmid) [Rhizobium acidisoli]|uniref:histidine kinase n=1 Tax=Rhizobium acidisoli TaxID=1538158 RepID=A0AAE5WV73_9HYPH|nr:PAS domain-containing sensor histidine kinase [Rhizobium acidisoli]KPH05922.1 histidine kinase [Rhizobium acidisoli]QAS83095.1 PAS domain-containing sensor histidine kinase [Rhizobium acidisoli]
MDHAAPKSLQDDFENLFENTMAGNLVVSPGGIVLRANGRLARWLGHTVQELVGKRLSELLTVGGSIYLETHLAPMLRMQGEFEEIMLEMRSSSGGKIPVLINGFEQRDAAGQPLFLRLTVIRATHRMAYEQNLRQAGKQARDALATVEGTLLDERETAALREQFIAVLGHDLRNPLAAIDGGMRAIARSPLNEQQETIVSLVEATVKRMSGLIDDIMDFARGRLGGGIPVRLCETDLATVLLQVVNEISRARPGRTIDADVELPLPIMCDGPKLAQLTSNLLANAVAHGAPDGPITITARSKGAGFELSVANAGEPIPADAVERLFLPFTRVADGGKQGLGLGLYIASEIAKAHGGRLKVVSDESRTVFTLEVPT